MSDIGHWMGLIRKEGPYILVPLNAYQMGNLLDALAIAPDTGDWWYEVQDIIAVAMKLADIDVLRGNSGREYTLEQVQSRKIREAK